VLGPKLSAGTALHNGWYRHIQLILNRLSHIHELQSSQLAPTGAFVNLRIMFDHNAELGVVAVVRAGVIIKGVDGPMSDRPDGPPEEITKVNYQVRWNSVDFMIDFPRLVDGCT